MNYADVSSLIKKHEGLRLKPYKCSAGRVTVGYGRNLDDVGINLTEAEMMLENDIRRTTVELTKFSWYYSLNAVRRAALVDMLYNLGMPRFMGFKKMLAALDAGDYEETAVQMLDSKWATQVGSRATELAEMIRK